MNQNELTWAGYWRFNMHRFAKDYLNLELFLFQKILLMLMNLNNSFCFIASRGIGKSFLIAVFACCRCILYPGTKICVVSGTRPQATTVLEKIKLELMNSCSNLKDEIEHAKVTPSDAMITFHNGSFIKVVTARDSSRGNRANIIIVDEFRLVPKDYISTVLKKFLTSPRSPGYLKKPEYKHLQERNKEYYLSSAYFKSHWSYLKAKDYAQKMLNDSGKYFICGFPYQLAVQEGFFMAEQMEEEMSEEDFNEVKWSMEMCAEFWGDADGDFFSFDEINNCRKIQTAQYPSEISTLIGKPKYKIQPKQPGEKRILSADIALMQSTKHKNDASAIFINSLAPSKSGRYFHNLIYTEGSEGEHAEDQALRIRKLYEEYYCDYIVVDCKGVGAAVYEYLVRDLVDLGSGETYCALSCCNNEDMAARCKVTDAPKVIWAMNGSAAINSEAAFQLREGFRSGKIRLLLPEYEMEEEFAKIEGYSKLTGHSKMLIKSPYINTTLLINEMINLQHDESSGKNIKLYEKANMRKDRYSSLAYNIYVSSIIERDLIKPRETLGASSTFEFRRPVINKRF